jgi:quinol monooxygenase YgiN
MSVIMTLVVPGDPKAVERVAQADPARMSKILDHAKSCGLIAHRFYGSEGKCMAIDEWPDEASFQKFFSEMESEIGPMMQEVATGEPEITFWHKLETGDDFGWDA